MQHRGEAQFTHLSGSKVCLAERASIGAIDGFGEPDRVVGHSHAVTGSHRISSFNRRYAGVDKSFNKSFLFLEQQTVLNRKRGLTCDDRKKPFILFVEVRKRRGGVRVKRCFVLRKFVQELYDPDKVSAWRDQRAGENVPRWVIQHVAHSRRDLAGNQVEENRLSASCGSAGDARIVDLELQ